MAALRTFFLASRALPMSVYKMPRCSLFTLSGETNLLSMDYRTINVTAPHKHVVQIELNRPKARNAVNDECVNELIDFIRKYEADTRLRCAVMTGSGSDFTAGLDLKSVASQFSILPSIEDPGRRAKKLREFITLFQEPFKLLDQVSKPIVAALHGNCIGLGMELAASCDIRYCAENTNFAIREVNIGIAADVGSLQKLPLLMANQSFLRELVYTGRGMTASEALQYGLVSRVCSGREATLEAALKCAVEISKVSPVAVQGSKTNLRFSVNQPFGVGLEYAAAWNMAMMQSHDVTKSVVAVMSKTEEPDFEPY